MSDDEWTAGRARSARPRDVDESAEFGGPLFPDEPAEDDGRPATDPPTTPASRRLRFGPDDTGPLPHWTAPPTGEIPSLGTPPGVRRRRRRLRRRRRVVDVHHRVAGLARRRPRHHGDGPGAERARSERRRPTAAAARRDGPIRAAATTARRSGDITGSGEYDFPESDYGRYGSGYGSQTGEVAAPARRPAG